MMDAAAQRLWDLLDADRPVGPGGPEEGLPVDENAVAWRGCDHVRLSTHRGATVAYENRRPLAGLADNTAVLLRSWMPNIANPLKTTALEEMLLCSEKYHSGTYYVTHSMCVADT